VLQQFIPALKNVYVNFLTSMSMYLKKNENIDLLFFSLVKDGPIK